MTMTHQDLLEKLKRLDEVTLLELLDVTSEQVVDRFEDEVEAKFDTLESLFEEEEIDE